MMIHGVPLSGQPGRSENCEVAVDPRRIFGHIFGIEVVIAAGVFVLVCAAVAAAVVLSHRRRRRGAPPSQREERTALELAFAVGVAAVAGFVVYLSFHATSQEQARAAPSATTVQVTAFQWCWRFSYPGTTRTVTGTCAQGDLPTMIVPVGRPVTMRITSSDVIHSWWVPSLRYKLDAFPDHTNTATFTVNKAGRWIGRCAEFCGHGHTEMDFYLKAVPAKQYQQWVAGASV
jgi:cytochrome c oxidase subunit 2